MGYFRLGVTLVLLESKQVFLREPGQGFTEKSCVLLGKLDQDSYSWKMSPRLKATDLKRLSKTWLSWGMTVDGCVYEHRKLGRTTSEKGGFAYLAEAMMPTPTAHNYKEGGYPAEGRRQLPTLSWVIGGKINPQFTEWMMGWSIDYTALKR